MMILYHPIHQVLNDKHFYLTIMNNRVKYHQIQLDLLFSKVLNTFLMLRIFFHFKLIFQLLLFPHLQFFYFLRHLIIQSFILVLY